MKVLIVEDDEDYQADWREAIELKGVNVVSARSIFKAEVLFTNNPDIDVIVMDACVPGDIPTTPPLVQKFRESFKGPMIAASGRPEYRLKLMTAGCDYECRKDEVPKKVFEVLGLS